MEAPGIGPERAGRRGAPGRRRTVAIEARIDLEVGVTTADAMSRARVMLDTVGNRSLLDCRRVLVPTGTFVSTSGGNSGVRWLTRLAAMMLISSVSSRKLKPFIVSLNQKDLLVLTELVEAGKIKPAIDRRYALRDTADALRHVGDGHAQGQTVVQV